MSAHRRSRSSRFPRRPFPAPSRRAARGRRCAGLLAALLLASPAAAATFFVTEPIDAIPPPVGSLRWAIDKSNQNGEADTILFPIDIAGIELAAPLPDLTEGRLQIGVPPKPLFSGPQAGSVTLDGHGVIAQALAVRSRGNVIADLRFTGFTGSAILRLAGGAASDTTVAGCGFFGPGPAGAAELDGVRLEADAAGALPRGTVVRHSIFDGLDRGIDVGGPAAGDPGPARPLTATILRNGFGVTPSGEPSGAGNARAIDARASGAVLVVENRLVGPGEGIRLEGADGSLVGGNDLGVANVTGCAGLDGAGLRIDASQGVVVTGNRSHCNDQGLILGAGATDTLVSDNEFGSLDGGTGNRAEGIRIEGGAGSRIRANLIARNGGAGILVAAAPSIAGPGHVFACNHVERNAGAPIDAPGLPTQPPALTGASVLDVKGVLVAEAAGWIEVFGDEGQGPAVFQGSTRIRDDQLAFAHALPVLELRVRRDFSADPESAAIAFATEDPALHVATNTGEARHETSEVSAAIPAASSEPLFDVVRGDVAALALGPSGNTNLGPVECLALGISAADLPVHDDALPAPGSAFFYVARRRSGPDDRPGTYDPAVCLTDLAGFPGDRKASSGDCGS